MLFTLPTAARPTTAFPDKRSVWLIGGLLCPACRRTLKASDVTFDHGVTKLICRADNCHVDVLAIERR